MLRFLEHAHPPRAAFRETGLLSVSFLIAAIAWSPGRTHESPEKQFCSMPSLGAAQPEVHRFLGPLEQLQPLVDDLLLDLLRQIIPYGVRVRRDC